MALSPLKSYLKEIEDLSKPEKDLASKAVDWEEKRGLTCRFSQN